MDHQKRIEELERALLEERRERDVAQRRAAKLNENVDVWRRRAEDRTQRIKKLESERESLRGLRGWLRSVRRPNVERSAVATSAVDLQPVSETATPRVPSVRCVTIVESADLVTGVGVFDNVAYEPSVSLIEADVVLVDGPGFLALNSDASIAITEWAAIDVRPPLVVTAEVPSGLRDNADEVIEMDDITGRFFDPRTWNPSKRGDSFAAGIRLPSIVDVAGFGNVAVSTFDFSSTRSLEMAATGTPFVNTDDDDLTAERLVRLGAAYRRFAFERRQVELERFADQLLLDIPSFRPRIAALLVSNRPHDAAAAIERFGRQRYRPLELIVGCHGFSSSVLSEALGVVPHDIPVSVREFSSELSLGRCLNECISDSGAAVIAKMDDDDHYGPGYLTDAAQALEYSGAGIIGKATSYTYLESEDRTVLRRPGHEETAYNGSPTGATLVWGRGVWERNPFPHRTVGEDYSFLRGARLLGADVYVNTRFEFVYRRRRSGNTWQAPDELFTQGSEPGWDGDHPLNADVPDLDPIAP